MISRRGAGAAVLALVLHSAGACSGGGDEEFPESEFEFGTEGGNLDPEDVRASPEEVGAGFAELTTFVAEVAAATGTDVERAAGAQEKILPVWESILGTVKANDEAAFLTLDDGFNTLAEAIAQSDPALAAMVAAEFTETSTAYLARFPASGPTGSPTPAPAPGPSSVAVPTPEPVTEY
ncbi:MAG: hypothetical protein ACT4P1_12965 [Sporichthyaceae bacterium]